MTTETLPTCSSCARLKLRVEAGARGTGICLVDGKLRATIEKACDVFERVRPEVVDPPGRKDDAGKLSLRLLPWDAVEDVVRVLEYGAKKYAPENWRKVPDAIPRYQDAALRHLVAHINGEKLDPVEEGGSGLPHIAHAACCLLFILSLDREDRAR